MMASEVAPLMASRMARLASLRLAVSRIACGSNVISKGIVDSRNSAAAMSNPLMMPVDQPNRAVASQIPSAATMQKARNRGGAMRLPIVGWRADIALV